VVHNTALNSSDKLPSYPSDNHHSLGNVYWRGGGVTLISSFYITLHCKFWHHQTTLQHKLIK